MTETREQVPATWEEGYVQLKAISELILTKVNQLEDKVDRYFETLLGEVHAVQQRLDERS